MKTRGNVSEASVVELRIDAIGAEGVSIARLNDVVHFVRGALPGEVVRALIRKKHRRYVETELLEVIHQAPERVTAPCEHFGVCGGCSWQHSAYESMLRWKGRQLADAMERIGCLQNVRNLEPIACDRHYAYRNKMEFSFSSSPWFTNKEIASDAVFDRTFALGLHVPGRFDKVRHISHCLLQSEGANVVLQRVHALPSLRNTRAYNHRTHQGFLRHLVLRCSATTNAILAVLITTQPETDAEQKLVDEFMDIHTDLPEGSSVLFAVNNSHSPVAVGDIVQQRGVGYIEESTHGVTYRISPFSFFQTNSYQMPALITEALQGAALSQDTVAWDLYCGTGTLTLPAARIARHVVGAELVQSSIRDAVENAHRNNITNVEFHAVDLHAKHALDTLREFVQPDVVIIDPPRSGMHPQVVEHLMQVRPHRISYVSCNPATLARDCALLADVYEVSWVRAIDMFPQTSHVEAVAALCKR